MAKRTILACDQCEKEIPEGEVVQMRLVYPGITRIADLCEPCADALPGRGVGKRGRKRKPVAVAAA